MDDAKEFVASMLKTVRDRLGNPLVSAFAIAWLVWNFRVVLVLIGDGEGGWRAKIDYLDKALMIPSYMWALHGLAFPLFLACIWIFALPRLLRAVAMFHARESHLTKAAMLASTESEPISSAERTEMWAQMRKRQKAWDSERAELLKVIEDFQNNERSAIARANDATAAAEDLSELALPAPKPEAVISEAETYTNAKALGLDLSLHVVSEGLKVPRVDFRDYPISWPWAFKFEGAVNSGLLAGVAGALSGKIITELEVLLLHAIRHERFSSNLRPWNTFPSDVVATSLERLRSAMLIDSFNDGFHMTPGGRIFLAWMGSVGFEFIYPSNLVDRDHGTRGI